MISGLVMEFTKLAHATVARVTGVLMVLGISLICSSMLLAVHTDDPQLAAKLGPLIDPGGWVGYLTVAIQVTGAAGFVGYGVVLSWLFSREFAEGTVTGLFAIPVSRRTIAAAKFIVYLVWGLVTAIALLLALIVLGLISGLGPIPADAVPAMGRQFGLSVFSILIAAPAAWAATLGRSVLAGIGTTIGILVASQVSVIAGTGGWFPFAAPALWAINTDIAVTPVQLSLVLPVVALGVVLTLRSWHLLQLDR
ncbi:ABC transporter permease [Kribbella shirazensis]|uniref:ABC-2 type transport system permease protein n=1 Tax=Kribbella shirazensis TaxID=1105143 RepID=A0A7X5VDI2_9ACTN|nr:ABC transporter permease [Kribbella shirazensis]NIK59229.1 ABC-2 type transport system permease protein [Kribbella shirazensis]